MSYESRLCGAKFIDTLCKIFIIIISINYIINKIKENDKKFIKIII